MNRHRAFQFLTLLTFSTLAAGAVGCSSGSSPTEPGLDEPAVTKSARAAGAAEDFPSMLEDESKRRGRGGDDRGNDDRRGRGNGNQADNNGSGRGRRGRGGDDNRPGDRPRAGQEIEGAVVAVNGNRLTLAGGVQVVVNGETQWSARGDLFTLDQVAGSVANGAATRVEARGARQADGSLIAETIKAEVDN